jgi:hypothetical protein
MGRRSGEGIATNATGRKFRGGTWENGACVRDVKLILEKHAPTKTQYPSAPTSAAQRVCARALCPPHGCLCRMRHACRSRALCSPALCVVPVGRLGNYVVRVRLMAEDARLMSLVRAAACAGRLSRVCSAVHRGCCVCVKCTLTRARLLPLARSSRCSP